MEIPKIYSKNDRQYIKIAEYKHFVLYEDMFTGVKETFSYQELGCIKGITKSKENGIERNDYKKEEKNKGVGKWLNAM